MTSDVQFAENAVRGKVQWALEEAGVAGIIPTPLEEVVKVSAVDSFVDVRYLPPDMALRRRGKLHRILGAVSFSERVAFVDPQQSRNRIRWTEAHELAHALLPWHTRNAYLDNRVTLSHKAHETQEREANLAASHLIFQGQVFFDRATSYRTGIAVPIHLARAFDASLHSTIRYYAELHPDPVAMVYASNHPQGDWSSIIYSVASPSFRSRYGDPKRVFPSQGLPGDHHPELWRLGLAITDARAGHDITEIEHELEAQNGGTHVMKVEFFDNSYTTFALIQPRRLGLGR